MTGDGAVRFTLELKSAISSFANTLGVYKVGADGTISDVQVLFANTLNVAAGARPSISGCWAATSTSASS